MSLWTLAALITHKSLFICMVRNGNRCRYESGVDGSVRVRRGSAHHLGPVYGGGVRCLAGTHKSGFCGERHFAVHL